MTPLKLHHKLLYNRPFTLILLGLCLLSLLWFHLDLARAARPQPMIGLIVVDQDNTTASKAYVKDISKQPLLAVRSLPEKQAFQQLQDSRTEAVLTIPKGYFEDFGKHQLKLTYRSYSSLAPALVDLLAQNLMPTIGKEKLNKATHRYLGPEWVPIALSDYSDYLREHPTTFKSYTQTTQSLKGLKSQQDLSLIQTANLSLGYGLILIIFLVVRSAVQHHVFPVPLRARIATVPGLLPKMALAARLTQASLYTPLWFLLVLSITLHLTLGLPLALYLGIFGWLILWVYHELLLWIYARGQGTYQTQLIAIGAIMGPAIMGGAFFSIDLLPKTMLPLVSWSPFYQLNLVYVTVVSKGTLPLSTVNYMALLTLSCLITVNARGILMMIKRGFGPIH